MTAYVKNKAESEDLEDTPLSGVRHSSGLRNQKASFSCSLLIIQYGMRLRNIAVGPLSRQWCENYPRKAEKGDCQDQMDLCKLLIHTHVTLPDPQDLLCW